MPFLKNIVDVPVATSNLKLENFANFEYAYLSKYLTYIMVLHTIKMLVTNQAEGFYS